MQIDFKLFPLSKFQLPKDILNIKQEAICELFYRKAVSTQNSQIALQDQKFQNHQIFLIIIEEYVIELDFLTKEVRSGFKCDFQVKFWVIRSPAIVTNTVGKAKGIAFQFQNQPQSPSISLFLNEDCEIQHAKNLQMFSCKLGHKYIVQKQLKEKYKAIRRIGKGFTACVYQSLCLLDKSQVAIKSFKKEIYFEQDNGLGKKSFLKEFQILTRLKCKYLSKLLGVYESKDSIYIVQELLDRTLHNYLQKFNFPDLAQSRKLLYQLLIGLCFLHKRNIMHRDIKLENILIRGAGKDNFEPVIADFGLAEYENSKEFVYIRCGTPGYFAPEIINFDREEKKEIKYNKSCDIFALGVVFHILLIGRPVFEGIDQRQVIEKNKQCIIDYEFKEYPKVSAEIKDLLKGMLSKEPQNRYTVDQLLNHPFFIEENKYLSNELNEMNKQYIIELHLAELDLKAIPQ